MAKREKFDTTFIGLSVVITFLIINTLILVIPTIVLHISGIGSVVTANRAGKAVIFNDYLRNTWVPKKKALVDKMKGKFFVQAILKNINKTETVDIPLLHSALKIYNIANWSKKITDWDRSYFQGGNFSQILKEKLENSTVEMKFSSPGYVSDIIAGKNWVNGFSYPRWCVVFHPAINQFVGECSFKGAVSTPDDSTTAIIQVRSIDDPLLYLLKNTLDRLEESVYFQEVIYCAKVIMQTFFGVPFFFFELLLIIAMIYLSLAIRADKIDGYKHANALDIMMNEKEEEDNQEGLLEQEDSKKIQIPQEEKGQASLFLGRFFVGIFCWCALCFNFQKVQSKKLRLIRGLSVWALIYHFVLCLWVLFGLGFIFFLPIIILHSVVGK